MQFIINYNIHIYKHPPPNPTGSKFQQAFVIVAFKKRVYPNEKYVSEKYYAVFFIFLAIMVIIFSVWDISWLNFGDHL